MNNNSLTTIIALFGITCSMPSWAHDFQGNTVGSPNSALQLVGSITSDAHDIGKDVHIYVIAELNGSYFVKNAQGNWVVLSCPMPAYQDTVATSQWNVSILWPGESVKRRALAGHSPSRRARLALGDRAAGACLLSSAFSPVCRPPGGARSGERISRPSR